MTGITCNHRVTTSITISALSLFFISSQTFSYNLKHELTHGHGVLQLGGFWSNQGQAQQININGTIGDYFNVTDGKGSNGLIGVGYFIDGPDIKHVNMNYGINWFYLPKTSVKGTVLARANIYQLIVWVQRDALPLVFCR